MVPGHHEALVVLVGELLGLVEPALKYPPAFVLVEVELAFDVVLVGLG